MPPKLVPSSVSPSSSLSSGEPSAKKARKDGSSSSTKKESNDDNDNEDDNDDDEYQDPLLKKSKKKSSFSAKTGVFTYRGGFTPRILKRKAVRSIIVVEGVKQLPGNDQGLYAKHNKGLFEDFINLVSITLPLSCHTLGARSMYNCISLKSLVITNTSDSVKIGESALAGCTSLFTLHIPDNCTEITSHALYNCEALWNLKIPDSCTLGKHVFLFSNCKALECLADSAGGSVEQFCRERWRSAKLFIPLN